VTGELSELEIQFHHDRSTRLFGEPLSQEQLRNDLEMHSISVLQALRDEFMAIAPVARSLPTGPCQDFVMYGVGRRMSMLIHALEGLMAVMPVHRVTPLTFDESKDVTRDLNVIYINIVGLLDNLGWSLFHRFWPDRVLVEAPSRIGLFTALAAQIPECADLVASLQTFRPWFDVLRERRDPSAHRIPLYLPPALLNKQDVAEYQRLERIGSETIAKGDWQGWDQSMSAQRKLGMLSPVFLHSVTEPSHRFYPVIFEDTGKMLKVSRLVIAQLASSVSA
jgi:hypothetical protein